MEKTKTNLPGVWILKPNIYEDERGYFYESYNKKKLEKIGIDSIFIQDNQSSSKKNTVRGIHFQAPPGQEKIVRCIKGEIWDVIVDLRTKSPTYKKWTGVMLSEENHLQVYIPHGIGHGFSVLTEEAVVQYKVSNYYIPDLEREIAWNDPEINVDWKVQNPVLSERDKSAPSLKEFLKKYPDELS